MTGCREPREGMPANSSGGGPEGPPPAGRSPSRGIWGPVSLTVGAGDSSTDPRFSTARRGVLPTSAMCTSVAEPFLLTWFQCVALRPCPAETLNDETDIG